MIHNYEKCKNSILNSKSPIVFQDNKIGKRLILNIDEKQYSLFLIYKIFSSKDNTLEITIFTDNYGWTFDNGTLSWSTI